MALEQAILHVDSFESLLDLLRDELDWPLPTQPGLDDLTFEWTASDLRVSDVAAQRFRDGVVRQLRPFSTEPPWGIFFVEFTDGRVYRTALRQVLRGLVPNRRRDSHLPTWQYENLLFICMTRDYDRFTFAHFRGERAHRAKLTIFSWERGEAALRTLCEYNLKALHFPDDPTDVDNWLEQWQSAFDVEKVTKEFFREYRRLFERAEHHITGITGEAKRLFTQKLFNRLLFIRFLEKKGWLSFKGRRDYLRALRKDHQAQKQSDQGANFYRDRLRKLFFQGLSTPNEIDLINLNRGEFLRTLIGDVPYLNGGLFEEELDDQDSQIHVPDEAIAPILTELFYHFNFTVTESTPLDIEVAVDPEMLGRIFEELVTGRHETGSYYTSKPVVAFMCQEALKGYLKTTLPKETSDAIHRFVEERDPTDLVDPEAVLEALQRVKVCDPACGSGAYLLGMLHELLDLRACLFAARHLDAKTVYERKLEIIHNNLYGVDIDPFAVNIARLRLWLSLVVDYEGETPPPLPNLDFKIEVGDSLTAPDPSGGPALDMFRKSQIEQYYRLKEQYLTVHHGEKRTLHSKIEKLRDEIAEWAHPDGEVQGFDWAVEFAEVFRIGGFDIALTNPPYVAHTTSTEFRSTLRPLYQHVYDGRADLYVYFYARAHQLLKEGGVGCFISSNKWLRAGYGEKLCQRLLDAQAFHLVVDFGELPVFQAATFPTIFLWQKQPRDGITTTWAVVKDLQDCYNEGIREHVARIAQTVSASQFGKGKPRLVSPTAVERRRKMEASGQRLSELVKGKIGRGIVTGLNKVWVDRAGNVYGKGDKRPADAQRIGVFITDRATRDCLIDEDPNSAEIIKPLLKGDDVRHYEIHFRDTYLLYMVHGVKIHHYPAVQRHLT